MASSKNKKIFLASDHAGFKLKEKIKAHFKKNKIPFKDLGPTEFKPKDDFPDYAFKLAKKVNQTKGKGIFACGSGTGGAIAANKVKGARAVVAYDVFSAKFSRMDNDTNVLCLRSRDFPFSKTKTIIETWIKTPFSNEPRHKRRLKKIEKYEK